MTFAFIRRVAAATAFALGLGGLALAQSDEAPVIAAAADLQFAVDEIAAAFKAQTGKEVRLSTGSTGNFARQIREGAPYQVFMAADEQFALELYRDGFTRGSGELYAIGRVALMIPAGSPLHPDGSLDDLAAALEAGTVTRFAIANPEHAPYGRRAMEALQHKGLWEAIQPHLVLGENVAQAAQFAVSGNAQGGIIALSLARSPVLSGRGEHAVIPQDWHAPLRQRMVLLRDAGPVARAFLAYMQSPPARAIMERYGFVLPTKPPAEG